MAGLTAGQKRVLAQLGALLFGGGRLFPGQDTQATPREVPSGQGAPATQLTERVLNRFEEWFERLDAESQRAVRLVLTAWEALPLFSRWLALFTHLSPEQAQAFAEGVRDPYRLALLRLVKGLCGMAYLLDEELTAQIGYAVRPLREPPLPLPPPNPLEVIYPEGDGTDEVDVAIVGSGAGGATVAVRLAEAGLRVALVEEGELATREHAQMPLHERARLFYRMNGFTFALGLPPIFLPMGCTVGGTTVVNSGTCFRTPDFILQRWKDELGIPFTPSEVEPIFERIERDLSIQPVPEVVLGGNAHALRRGAERLGVQHMPLNRPQRECHGTGVCALICPRDAKLDMRLTYLPRAQRAGARIYARCRAERVLLEGGRAIGVEAQVLDSEKRPTGRFLQIRAKAVVIAAGALHTPVLLWRSGIRHPHLGRHIHLHPSASLFAEMETRVEGWRGVMQSYGVTEWVAEGTLIEATFPPLAVGYALHPLPFWGERHQQLLERAAYLASVGILTADETSEGRLYLLPNGMPLLRYRLSPDDQRRILNGIARATRVLLAAGAQAVYTDLPGAECLRSEEDIERLLNRNWHPGHLSLSAYHPAGSCRMGENPDLCPVDSFGSVRGVERLWVADASLIPTPTVVNPQITIMMLAHRVAEAVLYQLAE
ncbi:MAG: GMC family oxidoreductase [Armatimonadota bacterium]